MFSPSVISKIGTDDKRLKSLPSKQRESLFQARDILVLFFKATQAKDKNISKFLGQNVLSRFPNRTVLLEKLLMYESDIDILSITKFDFEDENLILFNYYLVLFFNGNFQIQEDSVKIKKFGDFWKIISISSLD